MKKRRLFLSSVQKEFEEERLALRDYLHADPLLRRFFEVFLLRICPLPTVGRIRSIWRKLRFAISTSVCSETPMALKMRLAFLRRNRSSTKPRSWASRA